MPPDYAVRARRRAGLKGGLTTSGTGWVRGRFIESLVLLLLDCNLFFTEMC